MTHSLDELRRFLSTPLINFPRFKGHDACYPPAEPNSFIFLSKKVEGIKEFSNDIKNSWLRIDAEQTRSETHLKGQFGIIRLIDSFATDHHMFILNLRTLLRYLDKNGKVYDELFIIYEGKTFHEDYLSSPLETTNNTSTKLHFFILPNGISNEDSIFRLLGDYLPIERKAGLVQCLNDNKGYYFELINSPKNKFQPEIIEQWEKAFLNHSEASSQNKQPGFKNNYIFRKEKNALIRKTKLESKEEASLNIKYHFTYQMNFAVQHQESLQQESTLSENQSINNEQNQEYSQCADGIIFDPLPIASFVRTMNTRLPYSQSSFLRTFFTDFYVENYSRFHELKSFRQEEEGINFASKLFSFGYYPKPSIKGEEQDKDFFSTALKVGKDFVTKDIQISKDKWVVSVPFPGVSLGSYSFFMIDKISLYPSLFSDGFSEEDYNRRYSYIWHSSLFAGIHEGAGNRLPMRLTMKKFDFSLLEIFLGPRFSFNYFVRKQLPMELIKELLPLMAKRNVEFNLAIASLTNAIRIIEPSLITYFEKLFSYIDQNTEVSRNIFRNILHFLIKSRNEDLQTFSKLLQALDERAMLSVFYHIYFHFAYDFESLFDLYQYRKEHKISSFTLHYDIALDGKCFCTEAQALPLMKLMSSIPASKSPDDWPDDARFSAAVLVYGARCYMDISNNTMAEIRNFFFRFKAKCLNYCDNNRDDQEVLVKAFLRNIIDEKNGLCFERVRKIETLLKGLEKLIDNAIKNNTLHEQILSLHGLSLKWIDALHPILHENFLIVSSEMELESGRVGFERKGYGVTLKDLLNIVKNVRCDSPLNEFLIPATFRYLAREKLRSPLTYYRELAKEDLDDELSSFAYRLLFAKYVAESTGACYQHQKMSTRLEETLTDFLKKHPAFSKRNVDLLNVVMTKFKENILNADLPDTAVKDTCLMEILPSSFSKAVHEKFERHKKKFNAPISLHPTFKILYTFFEKKHFQDFLLDNKKELKELFLEIEDTGHFAKFLITFPFSPLEKRARENCLHVLDMKYENKLYFSTLFDNLISIMRWIDVWRDVCAEEMSGFILTCILSIENVSELSLDALSNMVIFLIETLYKNEKLVPSCSNFIEKLSRENKISIFEESSFPLDKVFHIYHTLAEISPNLEMLLLIGENYEKALLREEKELWRFLFNHISRSECYDFFVYWYQEEYSQERILSAIDILKSVSNIELGIQLLDFILKKSGSSQLKNYQAAMKGRTSSELQLFIPLFLNVIDKENIEANFCRWISFPAQYHKMLHRYYKNKAISEKQVRELLSSAAPEKEIELLELELNQVDTTRYDFNKDIITAYIAEIRRLPNAQNLQARALSEVVRNDMLTHYQRIMGAMRKSPVFAEIEDGETKEYTLSTLPRGKFKVFFKELCKKLREDEDNLEYKLLVLALGSEGLFRTTGKFPRPTQLISLIHSIVAEGNLIKEVRTGEGKSILAALEALLMIATGNTVYLATENEGLAREGLAEFQDFFACFDVPLAPEIIEAHTAVNLQREGGVHYGTPYGFALFFIRMAFVGMALPPKSSLVIDEFDSSATSTVQFRLAATLDPILLDIKKWTKIYRYLLDFVAENDLFLENFCSSEEDVSNFFCYCLEKDNEASFIKFVGKLNVKLLSPLIDAALLAKQLEVGVDFLVIKKEDDSYCAPILPHTSRADPRAQFEGAQAILHERENTKGEHAFKIAPSTETVVCISAKNFIDMFRLKRGRCIALTGTPGCHYLIKEFETLYGMRAFHYANFNADNCRERNEGKPIFVKGLEAQRNAALLIIKEIADLGQPVLLHVETAKSAGETEAFLKNALGENALIQTFDGYCATEEEETAFLKTAGKRGQISVTTFCHARGIDIKPEVKEGLFEIDCCTDKTEEQARQIRGRTSRNGEEGDYVQIIDIEKLLLANAEELSEEELNKAFISFMQNKTAISQSARLRTRPLEEGRFLIVNELFEISRITNAVLARQFGFFETLIPHQKFLEMLRDFYDQSETRYHQILGSSAVLTEENKDEFIAFLVEFYNAQMNKWAPPSRFSTYKLNQLIFSHETLKDFPSLNALPLAPLQTVSKILQSSFEVFGEQLVISVLPPIQRYVDKMLSFIPQDVGLKTFFFETLRSFGFLNDEGMEGTQKFLNSLNKDINEFFDNLPKHKKIKKIKPLLCIIKIEKYKNLITDYLTCTSDALQEKKWEELHLPSFLGKFLNKTGSKKEKGSLKFQALWKLITIFTRPFIRKWYEKRIKESFSKNKDKSKEEQAKDEIKEKHLIQLVRKLEKPFFSIIQKLLLNMGSTNELFQFLLKDGIEFLLCQELENLCQNIGPEASQLFLKWKNFADEIAFLRKLSVDEILDPTKWQPLFTLLIKTELLQDSLGTLSLFKTVEKMIPETYREKIKQAFNDIVYLLSTLDKKTIASFYQFDLSYLMPLVRVLIHPSFSIFLQSLPDENISFGHVLTWLDADIWEVPSFVELPLQVFRSALDERDKVLKEEQDFLRYLEDNVELTMDKINEKWALLSPELEENDLQLEPLPEEKTIVIIEEIVAVENLEINEERGADEEETEENEVNEHEVNTSVINEIPILKKSKHRAFIKRHPLLTFLLVLSAVCLMILFSWLILPVVLITIPFIIMVAFVYAVYETLIAIHACFIFEENLVVSRDVISENIQPSEETRREENKIEEIEEIENKTVTENEIAERKEEKEISLEEELIQDEVLIPLPKVVFNFEVKEELIIISLPQFSNDFEVPILSLESISKKLKEVVLSESAKKEEKVKSHGGFPFFKQKSKKENLPENESENKKVEDKKEPRKGFLGKLVGSKKTTTRKEELPRVVNQ